MRILQPCRAIGWTDASGVAIGGIMCQIKNESVGEHRPVTADNLLGMVGPQNLVAQGDRVAWQVDNVRRSLEGAAVRDEYDLDLKKVNDVKFVHRNLFDFEISADSNEREILAVRELVYGSKSIVRDSNLVIYVDNLNASKIFMKGSPKPRLNKYAVEMDQLSLD